MSVDLYNKAVELIGEVPPSCEFLYCIGAIGLFIAMMCILLSPLILIKAVVN